jgi:hypothetical protein
MRVLNNTTSQSAKLRNGVSSTFWLFALHNFRIPIMRVLDISKSQYPNLRYGVFDIDAKEGKCNRSMKK